MKLGMISLGCAKNLIDTELFLGVAKKYNIEITADIEEADILVVNTCGFIESAKKEAIDTILELTEYGSKDVKIIAMGCLVERYLNDLKEKQEEVLPIMKENYDGYRFSELNELRIFNTTLVMYYLKQYII